MTVLTHYIMVQIKKTQNDYTELKCECFLGHLQSLQLSSIAKNCCRRTSQGYSKRGKDDDININSSNVRILFNPLSHLDARTFSAHVHTRSLFDVDIISGCLVWSFLVSVQSTRSTGPWIDFENSEECALTTPTGEKSENLANCADGCLVPS